MIKAVVVLPKCIPPNGGESQKRKAEFTVREPQPQQWQVQRELELRTRVCKNT